MASGVLTDSVRKRLDALSEQFAGLERSLEDPAVLGDHIRVREYSIKRAALLPVVEGYRRYVALVREIADLRGMIEGGDADADLVAMAEEELPRLEADAAATIENVKASLVSSDDRQVGSVMLEVRAGTGGDEAGLWARDLIDVYRRYAERKGWAFEELDLTTDPSVGGIRHAVINVRGEGVWLELSFEAGVHSVKRVPATETQGRIHTSTATVAVLPEPTEVQVSIDWAKDVQEHVTTAQGPGGQNVNKVATAVHLVHVPTGVEVRMQETKSQAQNRDKARRLLAARVYEIERNKIEQQRAAERREQIGSGGRSEKIRVYRYQDNIVADQRLEEKLSKTKIIDEAELGPMFEALIEQETARRLAAL
ncbi:MAG: PCRF domain-containing protein [Phycisphaeraceae bacterium]|nr:PCRF domain-containing protein [Phycisphaeraceae bacterium]MCW5763497.1 PCRF domain-containing protein [Phycisphaeraceae bacterium]